MEEAGAGENQPSRRALPRGAKWQASQLSWAWLRGHGLDLGHQPSPGPPWGSPNRPPEIPGFLSQ